MSDAVFFSVHHAFTERPPPGDINRSAARLRHAAKSGLVKLEQVSWTAADGEEVFASHMVLCDLSRVKTDSFRS